MSRAVAWIVRAALLGIATSAVAQSQPVPPPAPPPYATSVSGVAPDPVTGDVAFGCPIAPFNPGVGMAVNSMDIACVVAFAGPLETVSAFNTAIASYSTTTQMNTAIAAAAPAAYAVGAPTSRTLSLATAYQATTTAKPATIVVNLTSTAAISLSGGATNTATVVMGSTNGVAGGTGTAICNYTNSNTGTLTIGLNLSTIAGSTCSFSLPAGWYFAVRQTAGTVTVTSAFDSTLG